jgi:transposase-like protein
MEKCRHCGGERTRKNGKNRGAQRFFCSDCGRTFTDREVKYTEGMKRMAVWMYLNGVGIRKLALFFETTPPTVLYWIRQAHKTLLKSLEGETCEQRENVDIIEFDEVYTYVQKRGGGCSYGLLILGDRSVLLRL